MKILFNFSILTFILIFTTQKIVGQKKYGNEWINNSKTYLKIKVAENAIYRITFEELKDAGFINGNIDGNAFKLINYGIEQAIHVSNNAFGPGSYLEFYGEKNTIGLDSLLYNDWKKDLFNPEYSLVSDTNAYFLTLAPENTNKRYTQISPDYNSINLAAFPYYLHEEKIVYTSAFYKHVESDVRYSNFEPSEGFGTGITSASTMNFPVTLMDNNGPKPILSLRTGTNSSGSKLELSWNGNIIESRNIGPKVNSQFTYNLDFSVVNASNTLSLKNVLSTVDRHRIAFGLLVYPRKTDFNNQAAYRFLMPAATSLRLLEISKFKTDNKPVFLYDPQTNIRYATQVNGDNVKVRLNPNSKDAHYILVSESGVKKVGSMVKFTPKVFANNGQQYLIISNKTLYQFGPNYVEDYANYRSSEAGGKFKTDIIEVQDIYDNFGYGIDHHFYSFKQMTKYMKENWSNLEYVFIIGKALEYNSMRTQNDVINNKDRVFFVPTFGYAGSDNMLFSEGNFPDPYFAVGRLAARSAEDVKNYLEKIKQYENAPNLAQTIDDKYWMKRVMHLGGGKTPGEQLSIQNGLERMAKILADPIMGAEINAFYKKSGDPVQFNTNEKINGLFNNGLSIINFFGHSSPGTWDFSIDNPKNFNNTGRYPFINSFGCYSGNLHGDSKGISESFVLEKEKGGIAFFASIGVAFVSSLSNYGESFFQSLLNTSRGKSYGQVIKDLATKNRNAIFSDLALYSQLTLHGDPAIKPYLFDGEDYIFDQASVKTNPSSIQASLKDFEITVDIVNLGAYKTDTLESIFYHKLADGSIADTITIKIPNLANLKTITIPLKNYGNASVGKNTIFGILDPKNKIKEIPNPDAENNNTLNDGKGFEFFVSDNFASIVYPPDFAMINTKDHFVLKASTSSVPLKKGDYIFQIDTTAYFNSPILETGKVTSEGGLMSYTPKMALVADRVYYWRVSPDDATAYKWSQASFAYIPTEDEGWNQSHFFQFTQNEFIDMEISEATGRKFEFGKEYQNIKLRNKVWSEDDKPGYSYNNILFESSFAWRFMDAGIGIVLNNQVNFWEANVPPGGAFGSINPTGSLIDVYAFKTDSPENRKLVIDFIEKQVVNKKYMSFYTVQKNINSDFKPEDWAADSLIYGKSIFSVLEKLGAKQVRDLEKKGSVPYILQLVNGMEGVLGEKIADNANDIIENISFYYNIKPKGNSLSNLIGKSFKYDQLKFKYNSLVNTSDKGQVSIFGISSNGKEIKIDSNLVANKSLNIDAANFRSIKLQNFSTDPLERTSPQLNFWRVSYDPLPDAAISFIKNVPDMTKVTIEQGAKVQVHYKVENTNFKDMDSILVKYTYIGTANQPIIKYKKLKPLKAGNSTDDIIEFTIGTGTTSEISLIIEINPDQNQPELYSFNNTLTQQFGVAKDTDNPLLQIAFDGIQIMDGDIVSPAPEICITLTDDNTFLPITSPESFEIKMDTSGRNQFVVIDMSRPDVRFVPASSTEKNAKVFFTPNLKDGEYKISVQGKDATGNKSGINPRIVNFKVITAQKVSNVLNYPNPFSTSTEFVFTLTGSEIPENISISIMTLTGKVVKEITKEELGPLRIGINRTAYIWNGTDDFGSKLANGVYLYKVNMHKKNGAQYDHLANSKTDIFFKEGFGKLVILR